MNRINPFDNLHFKQGLGKTEEINSPQKVNGQSLPEQNNTQGIGDIPQSDEDDFVDISSMIDDTESFNSSNFNFEEEDKTGEVTSTESKDSNSNQSQNDEELQKQINELFEQRN